MKKPLVEKAQSILDGIEIGCFDTAKMWNEEYYDDYYKHFTHPNFEVRKYSLLIFAAGLGNWVAKSSFIFYPNEESTSSSKKYNFEDYVRSFLINREAIKQEFPLMYKSIVSSLIHLDNETRFEDIYSTMDKELFIELRQVMTESGLEKYQYNFNDLLREVDLPTFFKD